MLTQSEETLTVNDQVTINRLKFHVKQINDN